ncbi:hypothetical protein LLG46_10620 [bacterium]|nr:hypothetical protein [bacterium]
MQDEFRPGIERALGLCRLRFGDRLKTVVLGGSVAFDEALAGVSDMDWFAFTTDEPTEADLRWQVKTKQMLERDYPVVSEFSLGVFPVEHLRKQDSWRFIIKYNSIRLHGADIIAELEKEGITTPPPSIELLKSRICWTEPMWQCACGGKIPDKLFKTPDDPFLASRKIARYFVLLEGAYLLMLDGRFVSFRQSDVLDGLRMAYPEWKMIYDLTHRVSNAPHEVCMLPEVLISTIKPFVSWMIQRVKDAPCAC